MGLCNRCCFVQGDVMWEKVRQWVYIYKMAWCETAKSCMYAKKPSVNTDGVSESRSVIWTHNNISWDVLPVLLSPLSPALWHFPLVNIMNVISRDLLSALWLALVCVHAKRCSVVTAKGCLGLTSQLLKVLLMHHTAFVHEHTLLGFKMHFVFPSK